MGASSSVKSDIRMDIRMENNTYISYAENDLSAEFMHNELLRVGFNMMQGSYSSDDYNTDDFSRMVKRIMAHSTLVIICISEKTVVSYHQAIEINSALESTRHIIYVFTDKDFTPLNTEYLNGFVKYNRWLPAYDEKTTTEALEALEFSYSKI